MPDSIIEPTLEDSLVFAILDLAGQLHKKGGKISGRYGITTQQWLILLFLSGDPNIPPQKLRSLNPEEGLLASEIADALNVSRPNITNLVNALLEKELVMQVHDSADRRRKRLRLTDRAVALLQRLEPARKRVNHIFLSHLPQEQRHQLLRLLYQMIDQLYQGEHGLKEP